jgi:hypothetical protein
MSIVNDPNPENRESTRPVGVMAGVVAGATFAATTAIVFGFIVRHKGHHVSESAKEMTCENDERDGDDDVSSDDDEGEIFDMKAKGYGNESASTDSLAQWQKIALHEGEDSSSYFYGE